MRSLKVVSGAASKGCLSCSKCSFISLKVLGGSVLQVPVSVSALKHVTNMIVALQNWNYSVLSYFRFIK